MSIDIKPLERTSDIHTNAAALYAFEDDRIDVGVKRPGLPEICAVVHRADFLAAVASELNVRIVPADAIVIERSELPAVFERTPGYYMAGRHDLGYMGEPDIEQPGMSAAELTREYAAAVLAVAEHLTEHPPLDQAQVSALAPLLWEFAQNPSGPGDTFEETTEAERNRFTNRAARLVRAGVRVVTS